MSIETSYKYEKFNTLKVLINGTRVYRLDSKLAVAEDNDHCDSHADIDKARSSI